jgi:hypothetical protein
VIVNAGFLTEWQHKGHCLGECMSHPDSEYMYVHIPKNASSWTKPNLLDFGWEFYNYHTDFLPKHALVVLRDPVERWLSGIAEYFALYHPDFPLHDWTRSTFALVFDKICFDDHTERQVKFLHGLDTDRCTFIWCDGDYRAKFSNWIKEHYGENKYDRYEYQHVSEVEPVRHSFKELFRATITNSKYLEQVKQYYKSDYELINSVKFYDPR